jgi:glycosyltransferase involved in cell wall biosynthesis
VRRRVGIVCDLAGEEWPSMDLVGEQLVAHLAAAGAVEPVVLRAPTTWRLTMLPLAGSVGRVRTLDRLINRYRDYPRWLAGHRDGLDLFHIVDHSYAHLVAALPGAPVVVTCHDTDTFRPLLHPREGWRPRWFHGLIERTAAGLRQAARVACVSNAVRAEILEQGLVDEARLAVVPNGVDELMRPEADADHAADVATARLLGRALPLDILHVGSGIPRKRVDVLLRAFVRIRAVHPDARLIRVGILTPAQDRLVDTLGLRGSVLEMPLLNRRVLAALYRHAALVMVTSDREGFGLPVVEALACGTRVVASDIPALRETGGDAAVYAAPGDDVAFATAALELLDTAPDDRIADGLRHAARFTWTAHAAGMEALYREVS